MSQANALTLTRSLDPSIAVVHNQGAQPPLETLSKHPRGPRDLKLNKTSFKVR